MQQDDVIDVQARSTGQSHTGSHAQHTAGGTPPVVDYVQRADRLQTISWISYLMHLAVALTAVIPGLQATPLILVLSVILDLVKRDDVVGTWQESHFAWRLRSVFGALVLYVLTAPLYLVLFVPGLVAWGLVSIWFLYRIVLGMVRMNREQPMYAL